jgi:PAS domain S-box-containing protein
MSARDKRNWHRSASLWANDDRFRVIFAVRDDIFIADPATGRFIEANRPGLAMFGYSMDDLIGSDIGLISSGVYPHTQNMALEYHKEALMGNAQTFEWHTKTKGGILFWSEVSISFARIAGIPVILAIVRDISERKRAADEELALTLQNLSAASDAKSSFLATMSHELRAPLNAIIGFSELMLGEPLGPLGHLRYREYLNDVKVSGDHLLAVINDILDLSRINAGKVHLAEQNVCLSDIVKDAFRMVDNQARLPSLALAMDVPETLPHVCGDERRIKQIILNLLSNAIKYTPAGGAITVAAENAADGLVLKVCDTGVGIAKADLPIVLERFGQVNNRLSRKHEGTGLGLPLAKQLIELHGGSLTIESEVGGRTKVAIKFPAGRVIYSADRAAA